MADNPKMQDAMDGDGEETLAAAVKRLRSDIVEAEVLFSANAADGGRDGAQYALKAVIEFLDRVGIYGPHGEAPSSIMVLIAALIDADNGRAHLMTTPVKVPHRSIDSVERIIETKVYAAVAMQLLMDAKKHLKDAAAKEVAKVLPDATGTTVATWRDNFIGTSDKAGAQIFQSLIQRISSDDGSAESKATRALEVLKSRHKKSG